MTVYVDDMLMTATVRRTTSQWSHLIADTEEELHEFAQRLGLKRAWFQQPKGIGGKGKPKPDSLRAQMWHYDVTSAKRDQAIKMGAVQITYRDSVRIIQERHSRLFPQIEEDSLLPLDV
jgi:Protein of unknown function (DUF4031)